MSRDEKGQRATAHPQRPTQRPTVTTVTVATAKRHAARQSGALPTYGSDAQHGMGTHRVTTHAHGPHMRSSATRPREVSRATNTPTQKADRPQPTFSRTRSPTRTSSPAPRLPTAQQPCSNNHPPPKPPPPSTLHPNSDERHKSVARAPAALSPRNGSRSLPKHPPHPPRPLPHSSSTPPRWLESQQDTSLAFYGGPIGCLSGPPVFSLQRPPQRLRARAWQ